jgi:hypothetical protein
MFRLLKLKPPQGWNAVAWELGIVTLGVLIALGAQQWAEKRSWNSNVNASKAAVRAEVAEHYRYAVEFRTVYPCLQAQLNVLRDRVLSSGSTIDPAPLFNEDGAHYVMRLPLKVYPTDSWQGAIDEGTIKGFDPAVRRELAGYYLQLQGVWEMNSANNIAEEGLVALARPLPLDPTVRYSITKEIEQIRGRLEYLDLISGQMIDSLQKVSMIPPPKPAQAVTMHYGTYQFCKAHGLPLRPFSQAMQAVPN